MAEVYNFVWANPVPTTTRVLAAAREVTNTIVVFGSVPAAILYPSLMTPYVHHGSADDRWIELLLAAGDLLTESHVNRQLKVYPSLSAEKRYHPDALFAGTFGKIEVEELSVGEDNRVRTHAKFTGVLHQLVRERLKRAGLSKLFCVRVHQDALFNAKDAVRSLRPDGQDDKERPAWRAEEQDRLVKAMLEERHVFHGKDGRAYRKLEGLGRFAFHLNKERGVQLWDEAGAKVQRAVDWTNPIQSYHPVYLLTETEAAAPLGLGHLTDIHINGRLDILQRNPVRVIPRAGADDTRPLVDSRLVSGLIKPTNRSFSSLLASMAGNRQVDALLIGGDLIDHHLNAYSPKEPPAEMQAVWDAVDLSDAKQPARYAPGVDMVTFYTLLIDFCRTSSKPVFGIAGNHDCYLQPFGISPRAAETIRANEGIPADLNMTFYEAALAFGPTWTFCEERMPDGNAPSSFAKEWMEWFYNVFTPFTDFSVQLPKQQLVALGWGDSEDMVLGGQGLAHLPRADDAMSPVQLQLIEGACKKHKERSVVLLTHFTVASFKDEIPLFRNAKPAVGELRGVGDEDEYNMGTFEQQHEAFLQLLGKREISCVLTGHSHRRGLYVLDDTPRLGHGGGHHSQKVVLHDPEHTRAAALPMPLIVVSDSAGPYPRFNKYGEFGGWGSDKPSGSVVTFDAEGKVRTVEIVRAAVAKPRLAVAVDYADVLQDHVWSGPLGTDFFMPGAERAMRRRKLAEHEVFYRLLVPLHEHMRKVKLQVKSLTFHAVCTPLAPLKVDVNGGSVCELRGAENHAFFDWLQQSGEADRFISVYFDWIGNSTVRDRYDIDSAWNFEVSVTVPASDPEGVMRYVLQRPLRSTGGVLLFPEVPDFAWRRRMPKVNESGQGQ